MFQTTNLSGFGSGAAGGGGALTIDKVTAYTANGTAGNFWFEIWSDSGGSPVAQIGADSDIVACSGTATFEFPFSTPIDKPAAGTKFWIVIQSSSGDMNFKRDSDTTPATGVTGGDNGVAPITSLVSATAVMLRCFVTYSDATTDGNDAGTAGIGVGPSDFCGILITNA